MESTWRRGWKASLSRAASASRARPMIRSRARSGFATSISASKPSRTSRSPCGCTGYGSPPSLAVLPFVNMSGDPEQEYFSDGITEDIIPALSKIASLFVIARTSTFAYKGKAVKVQQVGQELRVRYVLEGSVRKAGPRVRITAQLVEAASGRHLWAERYDRNLEDLFAVQDEITQHIVDALQVQLTEGEQLLVWRRHTRDPEVWNNVYKSIEHFRRLTREDNIRARQYAERAVELDPEYASAYNLLGWTYWNDARMGWSASPLESFQRAAELNQKALALDDSLAEVHGLCGFLYLYLRDYEKPQRP